MFKSVKTIKSLRQPLGLFEKAPKEFNPGKTFGPNFKYVLAEDGSTQVVADELETLKSVHAHEFTTKTLIRNGVTLKDMSLPMSDDSAEAALVRGFEELEKNPNAFKEVKTEKTE